MKKTKHKARVSVSERVALELRDEINVTLG